MATSDSPGVGIYMQHTGLGRESTMKVDASNVIDVSGTVDFIGGTLRSNGAVNLASAQVTFPANLASGHMNLGVHLFTARNAASGETITSGSSAPTAFWGGLLMPDGQPALKFDSTVGRIPMLEWVSAVVAAIVLPPIAMPQDFSTAGGLTLEMFGETVGTASAADAIQAITIAAHFASLTSASDADVGATHPNFTTTPSWKGITIASGSVGTNSLSVILTPQAHALRAIRLYDMRARYTRVTS